MVFNKRRTYCSFLCIIFIRCNYVLSNLHRVVFLTIVVYTLQEAHTCTQAMGRIP